MYKQIEYASCHFEAFRKLSELNIRPKMQFPVNTNDL